MAAIARKIDMMDTRLTSGQERLADGMVRLEVRMDRLEVRMDGLAEQQAKMQGDIVEIKNTMDTRFSVIEENTRIINRKLNALLAHMGAAE